MNTMKTEITRSSSLCGGKACLKGTRIRVMDLVERYKLLKESPEEIALFYHLPMEAVFSALSYYYEHVREITAEISEDRKFITKVRAQLRPVAYAT